MKIRRYFPAFIDTDPKDWEVVEIASADEIDRIPWAQNKPGQLGFAGYRFSGKYLMADYAEPPSSWVIGTVVE